MIASLSLTGIIHSNASRALDDPAGPLQPQELEKTDMPAKARHHKHPSPRPRLDVDRPKAPPPAALLYSRAETAAVLNRSIASVIRMEASGLLEVIKFSESPHARAYHRIEQVKALAGGDA
jgi:hypothetical protein